MTNARMWKGRLLATVLVAMGGTMLSAQAAPATAAQNSPKSAAVANPALPAGVPTAPDYVIGADDVLTVVFWRDKEMSGDVVVRPDGKITLPLVNEVVAAGLTPEQLRAQLTEMAGKLIEEPTITVVVKAINSRKVFVTGQVGKPGTYMLSDATTVLQMLAIAGGVLEYAKAKDIRIMRTEGGKPVSLKFNYKDVAAGKNLKQNIELKPGDTVIVP
jgi:polysaccharide export outer membrane protein